MVSLSEIQSQPQVYSANEWKDRIYINLRGSSRGFAGDRNSKVYLQGDRLVWERGKGTVSDEWFASLTALRTWMAANGVQV